MFGFSLGNLRLGGGGEKYSFGLDWSLSVNIAFAGTTAHTAGEL